MKNGLYFWKSNHKPSKKQGVIISLIVLILLGSIAGWYYLIFVPHKKHEEELHKKEVAVQAKLKQVSTFYDTALTGGNIDRLGLLLSEIYKSKLKLSLAGYEKESVKCKVAGCEFTYSINKSHVFSLLKKDFWNESFLGSFAEKEVSFTGIPSKLDQNHLLERYHSKKNIDVPECGVILVYIYSLNSTGLIPGTLEILKSPTSSVTTVEKELGSRTKYYGLLFGSWKMETKDLSIPHLISIFQGQAFQDDFIVKNVEIKLDAVSISGDFVCKTGS
ncbi:hypothetical protein ASE99_13455 [Serratia sp. Leaf51]|nr:hypothetical protein ASE99_13455 [Serratia sp. Leaf51]